MYIYIYICECSEAGNFSMHSMSSMHGGMSTPRSFMLRATPMTAQKLTRTPTEADSRSLLGPRHTLDVLFSWG